MRACHMDGDTLLPGRDPDALFGHDRYASGWGCYHRLDKHFTLFLPRYCFFADLPQLIESVQLNVNTSKNKEERTKGGNLLVSVDKPFWNCTHALGHLFYKKKRSEMTKEREMSNDQNVMKPT